jgi:hypothetical protein
MTIKNEFKWEHFTIEIILPNVRMNSLELQLSKKHLTGNIYLV